MEFTQYQNVHNLQLMIISLFSCFLHPLPQREWKTFLILGILCPNNTDIATEHNVISFHKTAIFAVPCMLLEKVEGDMDLSLCENHLDNIAKHG